MNKKIKLRVLDLSENQLKDRGAQDLGSCLKNNKSLSKLKIKDNDIMLQGGAMLVESIL